MGNTTGNQPQPFGKTFLVRVTILKKIVAGAHDRSLANKFITQLPYASNYIYSQNLYEYLTGQYIFEHQYPKLFRSTTPFYIHMKVEGITDECLLELTSDQYDVYKELYINNDLQNNAIEMNNIEIYNKIDKLQQDINKLKQHIDKPVD
ncbi:MAG: hypothetical protein Faunusvirus44_4 [Faunusvirus sp.]|jgi:hypothetical protein|uniref:Uncharacterized protein n=1 Tax=Faunusvirus sp. TaxID=2487766 RepID=A0A3G4ZZL9_9VIRU|nr:MAG: hypothetical protein Faunusvirus44_4 [Faunusvirus sp.]